jgi:hypothetical protein
MNTEKHSPLPVWSVRCDCGSKHCNGVAELNGVRFCCDGHFSQDFGATCPEFQRINNAVAQNAKLLEALRDTERALSDASTWAAGKAPNGVIAKYQAALEQARQALAELEKGAQ